MVATLLLLMALNTPLEAVSSVVTVLDCICDRFFDRELEETTNSRLRPYCVGPYTIFSKPSCEDNIPDVFPKGEYAVDRPSCAYALKEDDDPQKYGRNGSRCEDAMMDDAFSSSLAMVAQMIPHRNSSARLRGDPPDTCDSVDGLRDMEADDATNLLCQVVPEIMNTVPGEWLVDMQLSEEVLQMPHQRRELLDKLLLTNAWLSKAIISNFDCQVLRSDSQTSSMGIGVDDIVRNLKQQTSRDLSDHAHILSLAVKSIESTLTVLILEEKGKNMSQQQLSSLIKHVVKLGSMLHVHTSGWMEDIYDLIGEIHNIQLYEDPLKARKPVIRFPLVGDLLLEYHNKILTLREDFAEQCEKSIPGASEMLQLAEAVYTYLDNNWLRLVRLLFVPFYGFNVTFEKWQLGDLSDSRVSVDGSCVQLLVDLLDRPGCPLEDTPDEALRQREMCRVQLGRDLTLGLSYVPITSYLAYTQRVNINICLLSWMVINSKTICQDLPDRVLKSVSVARCFFSHSVGKSCSPNNSSDFVCLVSRAVFSLLYLATTVQLDSSLTLLSCIWLNTFCYLVFSGVRHLRLPDSLDPSEARRLFRLYVTYALSVWTVVTSTFVSLERVSEQYLFHSRTLLLTAISLSVACNFLLLLALAYTYIRTRQSVSKLRTTTTNKFGTRKQQIFMSAKTFLLSGLGILARVGFHQAEGMARYVYCVHLTTMLQGPAIFVLFVCNGSALPQLRHRLQRWWSPDVVTSREDLCSSAQKNLASRRRRMEQNVLATPV
ncbi:uncharacterized protein LOC124798785 [Schistocerca piceifrons]|uniref:uncharacterized protein LOC124798785 n=1 Tax=Schistocerca piceifrons TaxID=274613 RepID=UPI001F5FE34E|nr:uncharacterized protein LOC124798785 [Schistocerca piceifrons]